MLDADGLSLQDFDFYDIHEAFAAQVLCTLSAWESALLPRQPRAATRRWAASTARINVVGGSLAIGHPFAATGARIVATAGQTARRRTAAAAA